MFDLENPIPAAGRDPVDGFWSIVSRDKVLVPFRGNSTGTGHRFLKLLRDLTEMSDSFSSCLDWIRRMAFGGDMGTVDIIEKPISGFSVDREENNLGDAEKEEFIASLESMGISLHRIVKATNKLTQHELESGNSYLHIRIAIVEDEIYISMKPLHYLHCAYRWTEAGRTRIMAICKDWKFVDDAAKWIEVPVSHIGEPFNWQTLGGGSIMETIVHFANEIDEGEWYGKPGIVSELNWLYAEHLAGDYRCKVDSTEKTSTHGFAFPKEDYVEEFCDECEEGIRDDLTVCSCVKSNRHPFDEKMEVLREIATVKGKRGRKSRSSSIFGFEFEGDKAPTLYSLGVNRDTAWFNAGVETAANKIHKKMKVPRELAYDQQAKSGLGANTLINLYLIANSTTIEPLQHEKENYWSYVFNELFDLLGKPELKKYGIKFNDKIGPLVEAIKIANSKENAKNDNDTE